MDFALCFLVRAQGKGKNSTDTILTRVGERVGELASLWYTIINVDNFGDFLLCGRVLNGFIVSGMPRDFSNI